AAVPCDALAAVHGMALRILFYERLIARLFHQARDLIDGGVPCDIFPSVRPGPANLGLHQAALIDNVLLQGRTLGAQGAAVDGVVRVAFHMHHLRRDILGSVAQGMYDHTAANGAVWTRGPGFGCARNLELPRLSVGRLQIEAERRSDDSTSADF